MPPKSYGRPNLALAGAFLLLALAAGAWFRLPDLERRPMHTDEAVQAVKLADTVAAGLFEYDPHDYHGPGLIFSTIALRSLTGQPPSENLSATALRLVPALYGLLLIASLALLFDGLGRAATATSAVLLAFSPIFVFYSRYYIMEMPLVVFTSLFFGFGYRYFRSQKIVWAIAAGAAAGLMHATKETAAISWLATAFGLAYLAFSNSDANRRKYPNTYTICPAHFIYAVAAGLLVSAAMFSSFFQNGTAILDSFRTYFSYADRAGGAGHEKPWHEYLTLLTYRKNVLLWSELPIVVLGLFGLLAAFRNPPADSNLTHRLPRFVAVYTIVTFTIYTVIPYKTPWSILPAYFGLVLLAGFGAVAAFRLIPKTAIAIPVSAVAAVLTLWWFQVQNTRANGRFAADIRNPYVYAHTSGDLVKLADRILDLTKFHPDGKAMPVKVYGAPDAGWPLPWYLRDLTQLGFWQEIPERETEAAVFVVGAAGADAFSKRLSGDYYQTLYGFRPGSENQAILFVQSDLWARYLESVSN